MNSYEKFRALINVISTNRFTWEEIEAAGITKDVYDKLEAAHDKEVKENTHKEDPELFKQYYKEFLDMLVK